jgi:signal transduction histidine kinase
MKRIRSLQGFIWGGLVLIILVSSFTSAYFMTAFIYPTFHLNLSPFLMQIINSFLGLIFFLLIMSFLSIFIRGNMGNRQMQLFGPIIDAIGQIAKGDFNVRVNLKFDGIEPANKLAQSFNDMAQELSEMEKMRQEFISNVSHEIQSPLTSIQGFAQVLRNDNLNLDDRHHYLNIIETESTRLSRITDNLLKLASLESEQLIFEPKPFRLDKQIRELILACEPQWTKKQIEMDVELDEITIKADKDLLSQVWINLIHNCIKFSPLGGKIKIVLKRHTDQISIKISDKGPGISEEDQNHIFERFYKADKSRTQSDGGSGLGLSIAKKIIEMHRGNIRVDSQLGAGSTFIISLPTE